ncbi:MAG: molybdenum cofactor guanylyltransferase [Acidobacteriota bacterium]
MSLSGFIQVGGKSQRMGQNKALLQLAGSTLLARMLAILAPAVCQLGIITNTPDIYGHLAVESYPDRWPECGPLAGIESALHHSRHDYTLILACDLPFVRTSFLQWLAIQGQDYQVCVPEGPDGRLQPLCALYHCSCQATIERLLNEGKYQLRSLFTEVQTRIVAFPEFAEMQGARLFFENLNTPKDFARAVCYLAEEQPSGEKD